VKFTINGFSQERLLEYGLDTVDVLILRYFIDFKDTGEMFARTIDNSPYYWVKYSNLIKEIPISKIGTATAMRRRFKKLEDAGILKHYCQKEGGSYSFYAIGENYKNLISSKGATQKFDGCNPKVKGVQPKSSTGATRKFYPLNRKVRTKYYSIKDSSTKDSSIKYNEKNYIEELWNMYPNKKGKADYLKKIPKLLEKHGYEQLVRCIERYDKYVKMKRDTGFNLAYKNGSTFFNNGFVDYLDANYQEEKQVNRYNGNPKSTRFHNFVGRQYDEKELEAGLLNNNCNEEIEEDEEDRSAEILNEYKKWKEAERARASSG
jgi:DNA-binding Lrp family transcriptional regulator